ncbi:hypothetical protein K7G98_28035 [Saccharothrix sp. MB29]|nr:hypothetical protein [Saccharothrix sp. MB29]
MEQRKDYEGLLAEQRGRLARLRAGGAPPAVGEPELEDSVGTAGGGAVRVVVRDRRVLSITIGPGVVGEPPGAVSALLREAVNPALAQSLVDTPAAGDPGPDLGALGEQLAEFTRQGGEALRRVQDTLDASMAKLPTRPASAVTARPSTSTSCSRTSWTWWSPRGPPCRPTRRPRSPARAGTRPTRSPPPSAAAR